MTHLAKLFRALADANRLRILNLLFHCPLCVCDMQSILGLPQPFISRHLAYLRREGLVCHRREGMRVVYSIAFTPPLGGPLREFLPRVFSGCPEFQADLESLHHRASGVTSPTTSREDQREHQNPAL